MKQMLAYILIITGAVLIVAGFVLLQKNKIKTTSSVPSTLNDYNKMKGDEFEKYILLKFDKRYFRLIEWRSDKGHEGIYPESSQLPDMVFEFSSYTKKERFAIECKYRSHFINNSLEWANEQQIRTYNSFYEKEKIPVFIVIGTEGTASQPASLYIVPLKALKYPSVSKEYLQRFN